VFARPERSESADEGPFYQRWWFWTGAVAVVAGGIATAVLLGRDRYTKDGSIGTLSAP
jgi:hypothetical protein